MFDWIRCLTPQQASLIGSVLGVGGGLFAIVLGAMLNAHLNRRRDDRLRKEEATRIAITLREELQMIRTSLRGAAELWRESPDHSSVVPDFSHLVRAFPKLIDKITLLPNETIAPVIVAYTTIDQISERILMLGGQVTSLPSGRQLYSLPSEGTDSAAALADATAENLQRATDALARQIPV